MYISLIAEDLAYYFEDVAELLLGLLEFGAAVSLQVVTFVDVALTLYLSEVEFLLPEFFICEFKKSLAITRLSRGCCLLLLVLGNGSKELILGDLPFSLFFSQVLIGLLELVL
jgi:hypothetical protein